jgi:hypothetical protein
MLQRGALFTDKEDSRAVLIAVVMYVRNQKHGVKHNRPRNRSWRSLFDEGSVWHTATDGSHVNRCSNVGTTGLLVSMQVEVKR